MKLVCYYTPWYTMNNLQLFFAQSLPTNNPIYRWLLDITNFLSIGVVIVVTGMLIFAGIQYITSKGNSGKIEAAKSRIVTSLIALFLYIFLFAIAQWIIPGGAFNNPGPIERCDPDGRCYEVN